MNRLTEIFRHKALEVEESKSHQPLNEVRSQVADAEPVRGFRTALVQAEEPLALIAEVKKASPSQGVIRGDFDPVAIATGYERAGAHCLSVLTDVRFFQGSNENLILARQATRLPVLRKDFIFDPYQIYEARSIGADAILLIVAGLETTSLTELYELAKSLQLDVLVEVHNQAELEIANQLEADLIGINNRDLSTFETDLRTSEQLLPQVRSGALKVSESSLSSPEDLQRVAACGANAVLIGTTFCASPDIECKVKEIMGW